MRNTLDSSDECCYFDNTVYAEIDGVLSYDSGINCNDYDTTATAFCDVCATVGFSSCGTNTETDVALSLYDSLDEECVNCGICEGENKTYW